MEEQRFRYVGWEEGRSAVEGMRNRIEGGDGESQATVSGERVVEECRRRRLSCRRYIGCLRRALCCYADRMRMLESRRRVWRV